MNADGESVSDDRLTTSTGYKQNYKVLKDAAEWLRSQEEPDLDELVTRVDGAMKAYARCKERIEAVEGKLSQYFDGQQSSEGSSPRPAPTPRGRGPQPAPSPDDKDDEIPF